MNIPVLDTCDVDYLAIAQDHLNRTYEYIVHGTPTVSELPPGAVIGTWCISVPGKVRYILSREMEIAPGILPGDIARAWVKYNYTLPIKRRRDQKRSFILPLLAHKGAYPEGVYLDIRHAYLDVLKTVGYDTDYRFGKYMIAHPVMLPDLVCKTKWVYSIIVAMSAGARSHMIIKSKEHGLIANGSFNLYSNPCLYAVASEVLASIASQILAKHYDDVYYINTDGYIVNPQIENSVRAIVSGWGLEIREKARGETEVYGVGAWRCGAEHTRRYDGTAKNYRCTFPDKQSAFWLQKTFRTWHDIILEYERERINSSMIRSIDS